MAAFGIGVETPGLDAAVAHLEEVAERVADPAPAMAEVYASFLRIEEKRFANEGPGWQALADSTLAQKAKLGYPSTILEATGALKRSLTVAGSPGAVFEVDANGVTIGSDLLTPKGGYVLGMLHQKGTSRMPSRPVVDTTPEHVSEWAAIIGDYITGGIAGAGGLPLIITAGPEGL